MSFDVNKLLNFCLLVAIFFTCIAVYLYGKIEIADIERANFVVIGMLCVLGIHTVKLFYNSRGESFFLSFKCVSLSFFVIAFSSSVVWYFPGALFFLFLKYLGIFFFVVGLVMQTRNTMMK